MRARSQLERGGAIQCLFSFFVHRSKYPELIDQISRNISTVVFCLRRVNLADKLNSKIHRMLKVRNETLRGVLL